MPFFCILQLARPLLAICFMLSYTVRQYGTESLRHRLCSYSFPRVTLMKTYVLGPSLPLAIMQEDSDG